MSTKYSHNALKLKQELKCTPHLYSFETLDGADYIRRWPWNVCWSVHCYLSKQYIEHVCKCSVCSQMGHVFLIKWGTSSWLNIGNLGIRGHVLNIGNLGIYTRYEGFWKRNSECEFASIQGESKKTDTFVIHLNIKCISFFWLTLYTSIEECQLKIVYVCRFTI
jgi:hypothetical protein